MRRIIVTCLLVCTALLKSAPLSAYPYRTAYDRIMLAVEQRDEKALRQMVSEGVNINARNASRQTALCTTLKRQDAKGYRMLFKQGATVHTPCIRQISPQVLAEFYRANPELGRYVDGRILVPVSEVGTTSSKSSWIGGIPWPHVGEFLLAGAAVGVVALIGSGGKGNDTPGGYDSSLFKPVDTGLTLDDFPDFQTGYWNDPTKTFTSYPQYDEYVQSYAANLETNNPIWYKYVNELYAWEYNSYGGWNSYQITAQGAQLYRLHNPVATLPMVNAASAWVRGYTGHVVDRTDVDNPKITDEKIKVAVVDTGLEVGSYAHEQLADNISTTRLNFSYGPCSAHNLEKCWAFNEETKLAYLTSGASPIITDTPSGPTMDLTSLDETGLKSARDLWNVYSSNFAPVCSGTSRNNCLVAEPAQDSSGNILSYNVIYYPEGWTDDESNTAGQQLEYRGVAAEMWQEYNGKYGEGNTNAGYVYNINDPTPGILSGSDLWDGGEDYIWGGEDHGTHVAGIVAAVRDGVATAGVAPDAEIIPVRVDFQMNQVMKHLKDVVETDAKVVNLSLGNSVYINSDAARNKVLWENFSDEVKEGYQMASDKGTVLVFAAGNEGKVHPHEYTVAPLVGESEDLKENYANSIYKNLLISVIALDENKKIADYSNRCGASSMYCLAAPGGSETAMVGSTYMGNGYGLMAGTSQATPIVTGSVALLMGAFPFLKPQEVVQILFETADYIEPSDQEILAYELAAAAAGDPKAYENNTVKGKYNAIYGHGLVNLNKATDPVGLPKINFGNVASSGMAVTASSTSATIPTPFSQMVPVLPKNIVALDKYTRPYAMPTSRFINTEKRTDALKRSFQSFMASDEKMVEANDHLSFGFTAAPSDSVGLPTGSMTMQMKPTSDMTMRMGYSQDTKSFGGTYAGRIVQNPFMNMRQAWGTDMAYRVAGNWSLTGGFKYGQNAFIDSETLDKMNEKPMVSVVQTGVRYAPKKSVVFDVSFGQMNEDESLLGLRGTGAFETDGNKTKFVSIATSIIPFEKWQLSASYTYGVTQANDTQTLMKFSRLTSDAFAVAALYRPDEKVTYGLKVASPLRVRSGTVSFDLPTARDMYADKLYRTQYTSDMKPDAREYDLSLFFMNQLQEQLLVAGEAGVRLHPDHQKEAKPDYQALFKMQYQY